MRLIDADKVAEAIAWLNEYDFVIYHEIMKCINKLPTADAVEVVRCKDCVYYKAGDCRAKETIVIENEFCSWGVRRKDADS